MILKLVFFCLQCASKAGQNTSSGKTDYTIKKKEAHVMSVINNITNAES